jgi:hypothetical protein
MAKKPKDKVGAALSPIEQQIWATVYGSYCTRQMRELREKQDTSTSLSYYEAYAVAECAIEEADDAVLLLRSSISRRGRVHASYELEEERECAADPIGFQERHGG